MHVKIVVSCAVAEIYITQIQSLTQITMIQIIQIRLNSVPFFENIFLPTFKHFPRFLDLHEHHVKIFHSVDAVGMWIRYLQSNGEGGST